MSIRSILAATAVAAAVALAGLLPGEAQDKASVKPLRELPLSEEAAPPDITRQSVPSGGFERAYRQQPPLIPHKVEGYQISVDNNACMSCHDWPGNAKVGAPKISETHYVDRQGARLDKVAGTRYFCQQCHVPQADVKPLVSNIFQNATQAK